MINTENGKIWSFGFVGEGLFSSWGTQTLLTYLALAENISCSKRISSFEVAALARRHN